MSQLEVQYLDAFPVWLRSLADDAQALVEALNDPSQPAPVRLHAASALNYLVKSLDLIPEGVEDLGFIDDAFILRMAAASAVTRDDATAQAPGEVPQSAEAAPPYADQVGVALRRLASEVALVEGFLGPDFSRLVHYAKTLDGVTARGRTVEDILGDARIRDELCSDVRAWAASYNPPGFARDPKNLAKVRAFLAVKLGSFQASEQR
jgi:uncharacterized membrane protein YkvA (DUF1232 family)